MTDSKVDRAYLKFELREWSKEAGLRIPMPARGAFGRDICPWCGESAKRGYAEHVLKEHRAELKPYKQTASLGEMK